MNRASLDFTDLLYDLRLSMFSFVLYTRHTSCNGNVLLCFPIGADSSAALAHLRSRCWRGRGGGGRTRHWVWDWHALCLAVCAGCAPDIELPFGRSLCSFFLRHSIANRLPRTAAYSATPTPIVQRKDAFITHLHHTSKARACR